MPGTVRFHRANAGANSSTLQVWARKLHDLLLQAGWTLEYANADAIGTGSAASPNFDKAPAVNTSAGVVIYKMPLNGLTTPWFVRLEPRWGTAVTVSLLSIQTGTAQAGGVLANPSAAVAVTTSSNFDNTASELYVIAHPDALLVALMGGANGPWVLSLDRAINLAGVTGDDVRTWVATGTGITASGPAGIAGEGSSVVRSAANGEQQAARYVGFTSPGTGPTVCAEPLTMNFPAAAVGLPIGPYPISGGLGSPPRLWAIVAANDSVPGTDQLFLVDGEERQFVVANNSNAHRWHSRLAFARQ